MNDAGFAGPPSCGAGRRGTDDVGGPRGCGAPVFLAGVVGGRGRAAWGARPRCCCCGGGIGRTGFLSDGDATTLAEGGGRGLAAESAVRSGADAGRAILAEAAAEAGGALLTAGTELSPGLGLARSAGNCGGGGIALRPICLSAAAAAC